MATTKRAAIFTAAATLLVCFGGAVNASGASASTYACHYSYNNSDDEAYAGYYGGNSYVPTYGTFSKAAIEAQCLLNHDGLYPGLAVDGIYGANTKAAVKAFQEALGLNHDGFVGPQTWPYLRDAAYKNG